MSGLAFLVLFFRLTKENCQTKICWEVHCEKIIDKIYISHVIEFVFPAPNKSKKTGTQKQIETKSPIEKVSKTKTPKNKLSSESVKKEPSSETKSGVEEKPLSEQQCKTDASSHIKDEKKPVKK